MLSPASARSPRAHRRHETRGAKLASVAAIGVGVALLLPATSASAAEPVVGLGTAESFVVLAGSGITNTGSTTIIGDIGTHPTPTQTGFSQISLTGTNYGGGTVTAGAKTNLVTAYNQAAGAGPPADAGVELGNLTLTPGVYSSDTAFGITGTLTLDTLGDPYAEFIFQAPQTLTTADDSSVVVLNGGLACNVYWQLGSSATLGVRSALIGSVLATTSITATTSATVQGRLLALNGAVTMDTNTITNAGCAATTGTPPPPDAGDDTPTPPAPDGGGTPDTTPPDEGLSGPPGDTPTPGTPGLTTTTMSTTSTTGPQRPELPLTGSDSRLPLVGSFSLAVGVLLLGLSRRISPVR